MVTRKKLAELRESLDVGPMERVIPVCVAGKLVAEYEALDVEYLDARKREEDSERSNRRAADGASESLQIAQRMEAVHERMLEHEVLVRLRRRTAADWSAYTDAHPPRKMAGQHTAFCPAKLSEGADECDGCAPNVDDYRHGVDVDALAGDVGQWVVTLNDEPATAEDYQQIVAASSSAGDLRELARALAMMHEGRSLIPKSRLTLHNEEMRDADSKRRERTGSPGAS